MNLQSPSSIEVRPFEERDAVSVRELFIAVNRDIAPASMYSAFETYIERSLAEGIDRITSYYGERQGCFWVAVRDEKIVGMFGLEPASPSTMELRRMYVDFSSRRLGIARLMLNYTEAECRRLKFSKSELSTSELQPAAISLYRKAGFIKVREVIADEISNKTIGGGIRRCYFEKEF